MNILFCDINKKFIKAITEECKKYSVELSDKFTFNTYDEDIRKLKLKRSALVSPANSFGSMGGGIDLIYSRHMFPGIDKIVMEKISNLDTNIVLTKAFDNLKSDTKHPILPIGSAIITKLSNYRNYETCVLVTAPTMLSPMNVASTDNAYSAMKAILKVVSEYNDELIRSKRPDDVINQIVCPGLCTGVGCMQESESAKQILRAIIEFEM